MLLIYQIHAIYFAEKLLLFYYYLMYYVAMDTVDKRFR
jgi:hypothetical protein